MHNKILDCTSVREALETERKLNRHLEDRLKAANKFLAELERSKFTISKLFVEEKGVTYLAMVRKVISTSEGVVIEAEI